MTASQVIKRGELARRSGCNLETIRYYENIGLLQPPSVRQAGTGSITGDQARLGFILRRPRSGFFDRGAQKPASASLIRTPTAAARFGI
ncbi:MerR family DNA-binding transcriptional regulator [Croceicoccus naphthovorans]|uniref:MerR family DNA-binding transcriptional regulator n=1 Tax=Croceicoccus naphthovorans TaxID=1348774 RepID=UPI001FE1B8D9|nr:MerR family DNA-binding transcriptional regulator [Croceicoccus naphthovorans]